MTNEDYEKLLDYFKETELSDDMILTRGHFNRWMKEKQIPASLMLLDMTVDQIIEQLKLEANQ